VQRIHIACDAHLGREGFLEADLLKVFRAARTLPFVAITGMYGHFANIEDTNNFTHAQKQIEAYARMREIARKAGYENLDTHLSATSGLLAYEKSAGINSIVRIGIGMYGLWPSEHLEFFYGKDILLRPVLSWKSHVAQVKALPAGSTVGYGLTYMAKKDIRIALIPQGYADGYPRTLSNKGAVLIRRELAPVIGRVSMNMFVVDVSHVPNVKEGDEVVLIGAQGSKNLPVEELARASGTINYEATTRISHLLPRVIV
jgi:alanine racemase